MGEVYVGPKFRTVFARRAPPRDDRITELIAWCRQFAQLGLVGPAMGNLSFRTGDGFVITPSGTDPATISAGQFVEVLRADAGALAVTVAGRVEPSSESLLHAAIYAARPEVNAVFHAHSAAVLAAAERRGWPVTARAQPYGTPAMAAEALGILGNHNFLILRQHGFVALGRTMTEAGRRVEAAVRQA